MQRGLKKKGVQALGRSRGGFSTKVHIACVDDRHAIVVRITPGQAGDAPIAEELLQSIVKNPQVKVVVGDRAYDSNRIREQLKRAKKTTVIPPRSNRRGPKTYCKTKYRERNLAERFINRIKQFRAVATRYEKLAEMFAGLLTLTFIAIAL
jgi:transposase